MPALRRFLAALTVGVLSSLLLGTTLAAPAAAATGTYLRIAHLSPGMASADVSITSVADPARSYRLAGMGYGEVSDYRGIEPGIYTISVRPAGAPPQSPPMLSTTLEVTAGGAYTVVGLEGPGPTLRVLTDDLTPAPPGQTRLRVIDAAPSVPRLDVAVDGGPVLGAGLAYGAATGYRSVPSGPVTLQVKAGPDRVVPLPVGLVPGGESTVLVLERDGRVQAAVSVDARGPGEVPTGGIETGRGGTSAPGGTPTAAWLLVGAGLVGGLALGTGRRWAR